MAATITSPFRKNNAAALVTSITGATSKYYVGIGKGDPWTSEGVSGFSAPTPSSAFRESIEAQNNLMCIKKVETTKAALVFPNFAWATGTRYKQYDPSNDACFYQESVSGSGGPYIYNPCYVVSNNKVYLCVRSALVGDSTAGATAGIVAPSTYQPTGTSLTALEGSDGYYWAYLYSLDTGDTLNTTLFKRLPADPINTGSTTGLKGAIVGYRVVSGGTGYTSISAVSIVGDGTGATLNMSQVLMYAGAIVGIKPPTTIGANYTSAQVIITGNGTGAVVVPIISPIFGYAYNPTNVLPCWFAGVNVTFDPSVDSTHLLNVNDYRQITLVKDPEAAVKLTFSGYGSSKTIADLSVGGVFTHNSGARGVIVGIDTNASPNAVYIRQTDIGYPASTASFASTNVTTYTPPSGSTFTATVSTVTVNSSVVLSGLKYLQYAANNTQLAAATVDSIIYQSTTGATAYMDYYDATTFRLYYHQNDTPSVNTIPFAQSGTSNAITVNGTSISTAYACNMCGEYVPRSGSVSFLENRVAISRASNQSEDVKLIVQF